MHSAAQAADRGSFAFWGLQRNKSGDAGMILLSIFSRELLILCLDGDELKGIDHVAELIRGRSN